MFDDTYTRPVTRFKHPGIGRSDSVGRLIIFTGEASIPGSRITRKYEEIYMSCRQTEQACQDVAAAKSGHIQLYVPVDELQRGQRIHDAAHVAELV